MADSLDRADEAGQLWYRVVATLHSEVVDPDGDALTYEWEGKYVGSNGDWVPMPLEVAPDGLSATGRHPLLDSGTGVVITVTASDGRGGTVNHTMCAGPGVSC